MAEETIILKVESNVGIQQKAVNELRLAILNLRTEQSNQLTQAKAEGKTAEEINKIKVEQKNQLDVLNVTLKEQVKQLKLLSDIENTQSDTIKRTKAELSLITDEWNRSYKVNGQNSEATKQLAAEKLRLTEILKKEEKATGDTRRNVGNYTEGVKEALSETGLFSEQLGYITKAKRVYEAITKVVTTTTERQTDAEKQSNEATEDGTEKIIENTVVTRTSAVAENVETAALETNTVATQANTTSTIAQSTATRAASVSAGIFSTALKFLKIALISTGIGAIVVALGSLIAYFVKTEEGSNKLSKVMNAFGVIVKNITDVALNLGGALVSLFTGDLEGANRKFNKALDETNSLLKDTNAELQKANEIIDRKEELEDIEIGNIKVIADLERDVAQLRLKTSELRNKDAKAALAANQEAINKQKAIMSLQENELNRRYEIAKAERELVNEQSSNYDSLRKSENEAYSTLQKAKQSNYEAQKKLIKEQNTLEKEIFAEQKARDEERIKAEEEILKANTETAKAEAELMEEIGKELDASIKVLEDSLGESLKNTEKLTEESKQRIVEILDELYSTDISRAQQEYEYKKSIIESQITDEEEKNKALLQLSTNHAAALKEIDRQRLEAQLSNTADVLGQAASLFKEHTAAFKILASAEALINTYLAATKAYTAMIEIPVVGPILAPAAAAVAVAAGLANVAKINDVEFARGGILEGNSHAQGGIKMFGKSGSYYGEAEGGEIILTKNVSKSPSLLSAASNINVAAGGKSLYASGGVVTQQRITNSVKQTVRTVYQPVLVVPDVTEVQGKISRVTAMARD